VGERRLQSDPLNVRDGGVAQIPHGGEERADIAVKGRGQRKGLVHHGKG